MQHGNMIMRCSPFRYCVGDAWLPFMLTLIAAFKTIAASCGGYLTLTNPSGSIESPNYPNAYPNHAHCVWLLEAPSGKAIAMTLTAVNGERDVLGHCNDFVEIRTGNATSKLLFRECVSSSPVSLQSPSRWLWVRFKSNHAKTSTGFRASWILKSTTDTTSGVSPVPDCQPVRFHCANKECVSWAYHCDNANDCGCEGPGSDEHDCDGFNWTEEMRFVVGGLIGAGFFLFVFFGVGFLEIFLKRRSENEYKKQLDDAKRRARLQRNKPATGDAKVVPTFEGVKLEVPPSRTPSPTSTGSIPVTPVPPALHT